MTLWFSSSAGIQRMLENKWHLWRECAVPDYVTGARVARPRSRARALGRSSSWQRGEKAVGGWGRQGLPLLYPVCGEASPRRRVRWRLICRQPVKGESTPETNVAALGSATLPWGLGFPSCKRRRARPGGPQCAIFAID